MSTESFTEFNTTPFSLIIYYGFLNIFFDFANIKNIKITINFEIKIY